MPIRYSEGSSLPHFEGDKNTMTADEAMELTSHLHIMKLASVMLDHLEFYMSNRMFVDAVNEETMRIARIIMGSQRPGVTGIDSEGNEVDDDPEYYKFQSDLFNRVQRQFVAAMRDTIR